MSIDTSADVVEAVTHHEGGSLELSHPFKDFLAGAFSGAAGVIAGQPLDTVRIRLQQPGSPYASGLACFKDTLRKEGARGLFKGMSYPLATTALQNAVVFQAYGLASRAGSHADPKDQTHWERFRAGAFAGAVQSFICAPVEGMKIRQQVNKGAVQPGAIDLLKAVLKQEGFRGVWKGTALTAVRDIPSYGAYFVVYEASCKMLEPDKKVAENPMTHLLSGGLSGAAAWAVVYPVDVIKSRRQAALAGSPEASGTALCYTRRAIAKEGAQFLWKGFVPTIGRAFLCNAAIFACYEAAMAAML